MLADAKLRHHLIVLGDVPVDQDVDAALIRVRERARQQARRAVKRACAGALSVVALVSALAYGSMDLETSVRPADSVDRLSEPAPVAPVQDRHTRRGKEVPKKSDDDTGGAARRNERPGQRSSAGPDATRNGPTRTSSETAGSTTTTSPDRPSEKPSAPATDASSAPRVERKTYTHPAVHVGGISSGCAYTNESCPMFAVAEDDQWVVINVADRAGKVRFSVTQFIGPDEAPGSRVSGSGVFCGGKSVPIRLHPDASHLIVEVEDACPGYPDPEGGEVTASFWSRPLR